MVRSLIEEYTAKGTLVEEKRDIMSGAAMSYLGEDAPRLSWLSHSFTPMHNSWSRYGEYIDLDAIRLLMSFIVPQTNATLITFMLAIVLHPRVLEKAQEEMDRVVGLDRLPTRDDRDSLPYLECVLQEVYR